CQELNEGIESVPGWRKGVHWKKIETHWKIVRGSQKAYRENRAKDWTMRRELAGSSLGDSPKGLESSLGTSREIIGGRP
ncbi:hypothetical protein BHE74_00048856, partial [Ensete ventricosum]